MHFGLLGIHGGPVYSLEFAITAIGRFEACVLQHRVFHQLILAEACLLPKIAWQHNLGSLCQMYDGSNPTASSDLALAASEEECMAAICAVGVESRLSLVMLNLLTMN